MRIGGLVLALAVLLPAGLTAAAPGAPDPKRMVLQPADLPADFKRTEVRYVSNAQAVKEAAVKKNVTRLGRLQGYEARYEKQATRGILVVISRASSYKTAAGARESLALDVKGAARNRSLRFRRVPLGGGGKIGDEAHAFRATVKQNKITVDVYTVAWRSGRIYGAVIGTGLAGTGKPFFVVKLARRQQARLAAG